MQSAVIEKGIKIEDYKFEVVDVFIGALATVIVAFFIVVACASTLHVNNIQINEAKDAALALKLFAGAFASVVFSFGLFIASIFSATILPLATSFYVCEEFVLKQASVKNAMRHRSSTAFSPQFSLSHQLSFSCWVRRSYQSPSGHKYSMQFFCRLF